MSINQYYAEYDYRAARQPPAKISDSPSDNRGFFAELPPGDGSLKHRCDPADKAETISYSQGPC
ncbi:hypothetical protein FACS1894163_07260 [Spirochaetia bacterium]|nr:hypothetical protein FACS1894163_07260 [Spirochaetia bacterium]